MSGHRLIEDQEGFSLAEMLIAMLLMTMVLTSFYGLVVQTFGIWKKSDKRSEVQQTAQVAIEEMTREARQATQNDNYPVIVAYDAGSTTNKASIRFFVSNTVADFKFIRYRFSPSQRQIIRETLESGVKPTKANWENGVLIWTGAEVLTEQVQSFSFSPQSKVFTGTANDSRNLLLDIQVVSQSNSYSASGNETMNLRTRINLRNF